MPRWLAVVAVSVVVVVVAGCGSASSGGGGDSSGASATGSGGGSLPVVRLVFTATAATLPAWVAHDEGFFTESGLRAELNTTTDLSSIIPALGRQYDLGVGIQPVTIKAASKGIDVVQVSGGHIMTKKHPTIFVLSRPDSGILKAKDLVGRSLGAPTLTGNINYATEYWLKGQGVDISKIHFRQVNGPQMPDQLKAGRLDAAEVLAPYSYILLKQGYHKIGYPLQAVGDPCYLGAWIASGKWAREHTSEIAAFRKALDKADKWIVAHPAKARAILAKYTGAPLSLIAKAPLAEFSTKNSPETLEQWDPVLRSVGKFTAKVDYSKLVLNP